VRRSAADVSKDCSAFIFRVKLSVTARLTTDPIVTEMADGKTEV